MNKTYYYLNEARDVLGPVSAETLKELQKVGVLGATAQICEQGTETWLQFSDVFPDAAPTPNPVGASSPNAATSPPPITGTAGTPPATRQPQAAASGTGQNRHLKPILLGCGALALLAVVGVIGLLVMMAAAGSDAADGGSSSTSSNVAPPAAQNLVGRPVTAMNRGVGGGARIKGVIEQEAGDRCKVTITWISEYATGDLAPYGYGHVFQGDSVWTPKRIWSPDY